LAVDVLLHLHRHQAGGRVRVVWRADRDSIDLLAQLVEHFAVVVELLHGPEGEFARLRLHVGKPVQVLIVDVADGNEVADLGRLLRVTVALAADADGSDVEAFQRRLFLFGRTTDAAGHPETQARRGALLEEITTIASSAHTYSPWLRNNGD